MVESVLSPLLLDEQGETRGGTGMVQMALGGGVGAQAGAGSNGGGVIQSNSDGGEWMGEGGPEEQWGQHRLHHCL
jgi:hypothetical protein